MATALLDAAHATERDPRWAAVVARDRAFDGRFLLLGEDHRRLLSAELRRAPRQPEKRALPR